MAERTTIDVVAIPGGWPKPWPNVAEIADHLPGDRWTLVRAMVKIEGGTQALRRTINARLQIATGQTTTISVPDAFGALILKIAAYQTDSRDRDRHLYDAAVLLCCIEDPYAQRERFAGSDRKRLTLLAKSLLPEHPAWHPKRHPSRRASRASAARRALILSFAPQPR